jgi:hypothetical protein
MKGLRPICGELKDAECGETTQRMNFKWQKLLNYHK